jgi:hypothetical protein
MFELSLLDHLRLTFGHVVSRHRAHTLIASSYARWSRWLRNVQAISVASVAMLAIRAAYGGGRPYEIASASVAAVAFVTLVVHLGLDPDRTARAHADCATRLWHVRERYRALLADLADGAIEIEHARVKRDELMHEMHRIYEQAPSADLPAYQAAGRFGVTAREGALSDEDIEQLLPRVFHKEWTSAA